MRHPTQHLRLLFICEVLPPTLYTAEPEKDYDDIPSYDQLRWSWKTESYIYIGIPYGMRPVPMFQTAVPVLSATA